MRWLYLSIAGALVVAGGFAVGAYVGTTAGESQKVRAEAYADVYDCPGGTRLAAYQPGSRVFVVGQSENGNWVQIRNLDDPNALVWLQSAALDIDDGDFDFPTVSCDTQGFQALQDTTTTSMAATTTSSTTTSSTTTSSTTTTTLGGSTTLTTTPDTTPPELAGQADPNEIYEYFANVCTGEARTSEISVVATDGQSGVASVEASWTIDGNSTTIQLTRAGNTFTGTFPEEPDGVPYGVAPPNGEISIDIVITATDGAGNEATTTVKVLVHSADKCVT